MYHVYGIINYKVRQTKLIGNAVCLPVCYSTVFVIAQYPAVSISIKLELAKKQELATSLEIKEMILTT